jgi:SAM-dependent methyltransferase
MTIIETASSNEALPAFVQDAASPANAFALYKDWTSRVPLEGVTSGTMAVFSPADPRPTLVQKCFGSIYGWKVLELGSFEGGHTYQLESMGAYVVGIEASPDSFQRALIVKNALDMRAYFLLGDFTKYLEVNEGAFDLIFASGVLYHMPDPIELLYQISRRTGHLFLWTHYVTNEIAAAWPPQFVQAYKGHGVSATYYQFAYANDASRSFAGTTAFCSRMTKADISSTLVNFGFDLVQIHDHADHPHGPAMSLLAKARSASDNG